MNEELERSEEALEAEPVADATDERVREDPAPSEVPDDDQSVIGPTLEETFDPGQLVKAACRFASDMAKAGFNAGVVRGLVGKLIWRLELGPNENDFAMEFVDRLFDPESNEMEMLA